MPTTKMPTKSPTNKPANGCYDEWDVMYEFLYCDTRKEHCSVSGFAAHCLKTCAVCNVPAAALPKCAEGSSFSTTAGKCVNCKAGFADTDKDPATPCTACSAGTYAKPAGTSCQPCAVGHADMDMDSSTPCIATPAPTPSRKRNASCLPCVLA